MVMVSRGDYLYEIAQSLQDKSGILLETKDRPGAISCTVVALLSDILSELLLAGI